MTLNRHKVCQVCSKIARSRRSVALAACYFSGVVAASCSLPRQEPKDTTFGAWADFIAQASERKWKGQRTLSLPLSNRPRETPFFTLSPYAPIRLHATSANKIAASALQALEQSYVALRSRFGLVWLNDAQRGGGPELDFYIVDDGPRPFQVFVDTLNRGTGLDSASPFVVLGQRAAQKEACLTAAMAEALLMQLDPAESPAWRQATAAHWSRLLGDDVPCAEGGETFEKPWLTPLSGDHDTQGSEWLSMIMPILAKDDAPILPALWQHARQFTWQGVGLRASPDLWETLKVMSSQSALSFDEVARASARAVAEHALQNSAHNPKTNLSGALGQALFLEGVTSLAKLPRHFSPEHALFVWGSAYYLIDVRGAAPEVRLRMWLNGEYGAHWLLQALRINDRGVAASVVSAPYQKAERLFFECELMQHTAYLMLVVTHFAEEPPDADVPDQRERSFRLAIDVAR